MRERLTFLALAGLLLAPACILDTSDDDSAGDSGAATSSGSGSGTASSTSAEATADGASTSAGGGACGWGPTGDDQVPSGYVCGGDGVDPDGTFPFDCPAMATLEVGAECGDVEGPGCCDAEGDVWYCGNDGSGPALARVEC
ncbi:MAG: hypothetical protein H6712_22360 [Myxococcales bacterium]|nr:hypothetical protein [Myxococcales bacterium]MCB9716619.1 hypothetical protein [Myxococcales bacterium]